jgi:hypothetical protein
MTAEDPSPVFGRANRLLGPERFEAYLQHNASLHVMTMTLSLSIGTALGTGYDQDVLDAIHEDAQDLREAADRYSAWADRLADDWQAQRQEQTP